MEISKLHEHIDHQRWLLEHGFINDLHKDNLFGYGAVVHKEVEAVELSIDVENKTVYYQLYVSPRLLKLIDDYHRLSESTSIIGLWKFKRMLRKEGNLNLEHLLSRFVQDYCGPKWAVELDIKDYSGYEDGFKEETTESGDGQTDKQPDG